MQSVVKTLINHRWKYKVQLKNCADCKHLSFIIDSNGEDKHFCKVYHETFLGKCPSKVTVIGEKECQ